MIDVRLFEPDLVRPMTRAEYHALGRLGYFDEERVELLGGVVVKVSPSGRRHSLCVDWLCERLVLALTPRATVRCGTPLSTDEYSEPEPDLSVVVRRDYDDKPRPEDTLLAIEVSDSSLRKDLDLKGPHYASAGIPEYWVVNLVDDCVHVYTDPSDGAYRTTRSYQLGETVSPAALADVSLPVAELIPRRRAGE